MDSALTATMADHRRTMRIRSRHETANNGYLDGIVATVANYVIGNGPKLVIDTGDDAKDEAIERDWLRWARKIDLAEKLRLMRRSQAESGECFAVAIDNPRMTGWTRLDIAAVEADRVANPSIFAASDVTSAASLGGIKGLPPDAAASIDGVILDATGNAIAYVVLRKHPGDNAWWGASGTEYDVLSASRVFHLVARKRPGQVRGVPELAATIGLFGMMRRYSLAVVNAAENAAMIGGVITTGAGADTGNDTNETTGVMPYEGVEFERGMWMQMPSGSNINQVRAEQPTDAHESFLRSMLGESSRPIGMPVSVASGDSSQHNYASGRLDWQAFHRAIEIDRDTYARTILDPLFRMWAREYELANGPGAIGQLTDEFGDVRPDYEWVWPPFEHVDPKKEADAQAIRLASGVTTLAVEAAKQQMSWRTLLKQRARERELKQKLGLPVDDVTKRVKR
jgi:lambda family phage portal protein